MADCICQYIDGVRINPFCPVHGLSDMALVDKLIKNEQARFEEAKRELLIKGRLDEKRLRLRPRERRIRRVIRQEIMAERR